MRRLALAAIIGFLGWTALASGEAIQKWRTPAGSLFFGDHPPPGSTLLATYPDTASPPITVIPGEMASFSQAAADGREIIRRREEERAAEHRADAEREASQAAVEARTNYDAFEPFWFISSTVSPCRFGDSCFDHDRGHHHHQHFPGNDRESFNRRNQSLTPAPIFRPQPAPPPIARQFGGSQTRSPFLR